MVVEACRALLFGLFRLVVVRRVRVVESSGGVLCGVVWWSTSWRILGHQEGMLRAFEGFFGGGRRTVEHAPRSTHYVQHLM